MGMLEGKVVLVTGAGTGIGKGNIAIISSTVSPNVSRRSLSRAAVANSQPKGSTRTGFVLVP